MIFLFLLCTILLIFFTYRNFNSLTGFLLGVFTISWLIAYISFILYLSKFNVYNSVLEQFIDLNPGTWNSIMLKNLNSNVIIRFFNLGIHLFYFSFLAYSISFLGPKTRKKTYLYLVIAILPFIQLIYFDPAVQIGLQDLASLGQSFDFYTIINDKITFIFKLVNISYLVIGVSLLIYHTIRNYSLRYIRHYTIYSVISVIPLLSIHLFVFYWAPFVLLRVTVIKSYINYLLPPIHPILFEYKFFAYIVLAAIILMIINVYKYSSIESHYSNVRKNTKRKIDTASLGIRAFTHAVKNHLLAIRSEAEYLKDKYKDDEDTLYSLKLIFDSCEASFQSLDDANTKLKEITLSMEIVPLHEPVETALKRFNWHSVKPKLHFTVQKNCSVYMDPAYIQEVIHNLLKNSLEALGDEGDVRIIVSYVGDWATIIIQDNGPGIPSEHLNEIFTPFFSTKPSLTNWGIGLSFCHKVIDAHGGKIEVLSEVDKGTQFNILLPLYKTREVQKHKSLFKWGKNLWKS